MRPDPVHLPGRLSIMERHAGPSGLPRDRGHRPAQPAGGGVRLRVPRQPGQWWHDVVRAGVTAASGAAAATRWLADPLEIAEVHVRPEYQHRGIGRRLLLTLSGGRAERTAVLSTQDANSPARRLYRGWASPTC